MIKVKAVYPKEAEVTLKMDLESATILRLALEFLEVLAPTEDITGYVMDFAECNETQVASVLNGLIAGIREVDGL